MDALAQIVQDGATDAEQALARHHLERMRVRLEAPELMNEAIADFSSVCGGD
jgi:hypothetical protein